jgi:hypothetical protein
MRELAASLLTSSGKLIFLGRGYYGDLVRQLKASTLPRTLTERVILVDSVEECLETLSPTPT